MLDKVNFTDNGDGTFNKQIISNVTLTKEQLVNEKLALEAQAANFAIGRSSDTKTQDDIDATIKNVNDSLAFLADVVAIPINIGVSADAKIF